MKDKGKGIYMNCVVQYIGMQGDRKIFDLPSGKLVALLLNNIPAASQLAHDAQQNVIRLWGTIDG